MNIKRISLLSIILVLGLIMLTGCLSKTAITEADFKTKMEAKEYIVLDILDQFADTPQVKSATIARDGTGSYQIEFYEMDSISSANQAYAKNTSDMEAAKGSGSLSTTINGTNYSKATLESNGEFWVVESVDSTFVFVHVDKAYKTAVNEALDAIGY